MRAIYAAWFRVNTHSVYMRIGTSVTPPAQCRASACYLYLYLFQCWYARSACNCVSERIPGWVRTAGADQANEVQGDLCCRAASATP